MLFATRLEGYLQDICGQFQETPGLRVKLEQAERLWDLDRRELELLLNTFVDVGFLRCAADGS